MPKKKSKNTQETDNTPNSPVTIIDTPVGVLDIPQIVDTSEKSIATEVLENGSTLVLNEDTDNDTPNIDALANSDETNGVSKPEDSTKPESDTKPLTEAELLEKQIADAKKLLESLEADKKTVDVLPMLENAMNQVLASLSEEQRKEIPNKKEFWAGWKSDTEGNLKVSLKLVRPGMVVAPKESKPVATKQKPIVESLVGATTDEIANLNSKKLNRDFICGKLGITKPEIANPKEFLERVQELAPQKLTFRMESIPS